MVHKWQHFWVNYPFNYQHMTDHLPCCTTNPIKKFKEIWETADYFHQYWWWLLPYPLLPLPHCAVPLACLSVGPRKSVTPCHSGGSDRPGTRLISQPWLHLGGVGRQRLHSRPERPHPPSQKHTDNMKQGVWERSSRFVVSIYSSH